MNYHPFKPLSRAIWSVSTTTKLQLLTLPQLWNRLPFFTCHNTFCNDLPHLFLDIFNWEGSIDYLQQTLQCWTKINLHPNKFVFFRHSNIAFIVQKQFVRKKKKKQKNAKTKEWFEYDGPEFGFKDYFLEQAQNMTPAKMLSFNFRKNMFNVMFVSF